MLGYAVGAATIGAGAALMTSGGTLTGDVGASGAADAAMGMGAAATTAAGTTAAAVATLAGAASTWTESVISLAALRNSLMLLPSAAPTSGSLPGPITIKAMIRTMTR